MLREAKISELADGHHGCRREAAKQGGRQHESHERLDRHGRREIVRHQWDDGLVPIFRLARHGIVPQRLSAYTPGQLRQPDLRGELNAGRHPPAALGPRSPQDAEGQGCPAGSGSHGHQRPMRQRPVRHEDHPDEHHRPHDGDGPDDLVWRLADLDHPPEADARQDHGRERSAFRPADEYQPSERRGEQPDGREDRKRDPGSDQQQQPEPALPGLGRGRHQAVERMNGSSAM